MISVFTANGTLQLALAPSNEIEKLLLQQLAGGPVEIRIMDKLQIVDKQYNDAVIITPVVAKTA